MNKENKTGVIIFGMAVLLLFIFFPALMLHPDSSMFSMEGDGIKNYFSVLYYLRNDTGFHFSGMNYPFGEHLSFADGQPGIIVPFHYLTYLFPSLKNYGIALINLSALLSFAAGVWFIYRILLFYRVQYLFAAVGSLLVVFLSPQLFRLQAHYALSYACFFPMAWYCSIKINSSKQLLKWSITAVTLLVFFGLLHFYLAAVSVLFLFCFAFLKSLFRFKQVSVQRHLANWLVPAAVLFLLQLFMLFTDHIADRPPRPWGFFYAIADWTTVFLPHPTDLFGNPSRALPGFSEGFAYIGLMPIAALVFMLIRLLLNCFRFSFNKIRRQWSADPSLYFLSSVPVLLFSMCIPFVWGLENLVDYIPSLRQFRVLGRFAWAFYYAAAVQAVVFFYACYRMYGQHRLKRTATVLLALTAFIWMAEVTVRMKEVNKRFGDVRENYRQFADNRFLQQINNAGYQSSDFQAILTLPFFHLGSEQFSIEHGPSQQNAMRAAYQLHIPAINVMMSRTSLQQSCDVVQLLSDSLIEKKLYSRLNNKPLLLITWGTDFSAQERRLIAKAKLISEYAETRLYALPVSVFVTDADVVIRRFNGRQQQLKEHKGYWSTKDSSIAYFNYFNGNDIPLSGFTPIAENGSTVLFENKFSAVHIADTMEVSLWVKIDPANESLPLLQYERRNKEGVSQQKEEYAFKFQTDIYNGCVLLKQQFIIQSPDDYAVFRITGKGAFSNLLIREMHEDIFQPIPGFGFYVNNIPVKNK